MVTLFQWAVLSQFSADGGYEYTEAEGLVPDELVSMGLATVDRESNDEFDFFAITEAGRAAMREFEEKWRR